MSLCMSWLSLSSSKIGEEKGPPKCWQRGEDLEFMERASLDIENDGERQDIFLLNSRKLELLCS